MSTWTDTRAANLWPWPYSGHILAREMEVELAQEALAALPLPTLGHRAANSERPLWPSYHQPIEDFVLVRAPGNHDLFQVQSTVTGQTLTAPKPLPGAKLALARMRSVMGQMGKV